MHKNFSSALTLALISKPTFALSMKLDSSAPEDINIEL